MSISDQTAYTRTYKNTHMTLGGESSDPYTVPTTRSKSVQQQETDQQEQETYEVVDMATSNNLPLDKFDGKSDGCVWLKKFKRFCELQKRNDDDAVKMMPIFLTGVAENWFNGLSDEDSNSTELLVKFKCRFSGLDNVTLRTETYQKCKMQPGEDVEVYIDKLCRLGAQLGKSKEDIVVQAQLGLSDNIKAYVMGREPDSLEKVVKFARMAGGNGATDVLLAGLVQKVDLIYSNQQTLQQQMAVTPEPDVDAIQTNYWQRNSYHRGGQPQQQQGNYHFSAPYNARYNNAPVYDRYSAQNMQSRSHNRGGYNQSHRGAYTQNDRQREQFPECYRCGRTNHHSDNCRHHTTWKTVCNKCHNVGHMTHKCRISQNQFAERTDKGNPNNQGRR